MASKWVYRFSEGNKDMKELLGGKGANLAEMTTIGLPVPPGFTITTEVCNYYSANGGYPEGVDAQLEAALASLEADTGKIVRRRRRPAAAQRALRRPRQHAGHDGHDPQPRPQRRHGPGRRREHRQPALRLRLLPPLREHVRRRRARLQAGGRGRARIPSRSCLEAMKKAKGAEVRHRPHRRRPQGAGRPSSRRPSRSAPATTSPTTRASSSGAPSRPCSAAGTTTAPSPTGGMYGIPDDWGTAVNVQTMVYGNTGDESGTGVAFTRNPASGENVFYGEFLVNAQGEDVVAGVRTPRQAIELERRLAGCLRRSSWTSARRSSHELRDMQDFEFTIEKGRLFMLQTRNGKRTGLAAIRIAVDLADEGLITPRRGADAHRARAAQPACCARSSRPTTACARSSRAGSWPRACPPAPAPPAAASSSTLPGRRRVVRARRAGPARPRLHQPGRHPRHGGRPGHPHRSRAA